MRSVAKRFIFGILATAKENRFRLLGLIVGRRKRGAVMASITKGLRLALPAGAPDIRLAFFHIDAIRRGLGDGWLVHGGWFLLVQFKWWAYRRL